MEDKRKFPRFSKRIEAAYSLLIDAPDDERVRQTESVNLSRGGCTLAMHGSERAGTRVAVHLALPSGEEVAIQGCIAWVRESLPGQPGAMGIYFAEHQALPAGYLALLDDAEQAGGDRTG